MLKDLKDGGHKWAPQPGLEIPKGRKKESESPASAAKREVREELGIDCSQCSLESPLYERYTGMDNVVYSTVAFIHVADHNSREDLLSVTNRSVPAGEVYCIRWLSCDEFVEMTAHVSGRDMRLASIKELDALLRVRASRARRHLTIQ